MQCEEEKDQNELKHEQDMEEHMAVNQESKLYHIQEKEDGELDIQEIDQKPWTKDMLDENDVYLVELQHIIYIWIGKGATKTEREHSFIIV